MVPSNSGCTYQRFIDRFIGVVILNFIDPALLLSAYGFACSLFTLLVSLVPGKAGVGFLFCLFFFESICYPVSTIAPFSIRSASTNWHYVVYLHIGYQELGRPHKERVRIDCDGARNKMANLMRCARTNVVLPRVSVGVLGTRLHKPVLRIRPPPATRTWSPFQDI